MKHPIFVFGSNLAGRHGAGAAFFARKFRGAKAGVGVGRTGDAYAIPTKAAQLRPLSLVEIRYHVDTFLGYARTNPDLVFEVTRIGCGLAGYTDADIGPFFRDAPSNCTLPAEWPAARADIDAERAWSSAARVIKTTGGCPAEVLRQAGESLDHWRHNKFVGLVPSSGAADDED